MSPVKNLGSSAPKKYPLCKFVNDKYELCQNGGGGDTEVKGYQVTHHLHFATLSAPNFSDNELFLVGLIEKRIKPKK